jgi:chemosensory pili system protein ChpA (sensor histidine kinase/response regulator)
VVDDSVTVRKVTSRILRRQGYTVLTAKDGIEALKVMQDEIPAVILLDIEMPRMDGFEVATRVRASDELSSIPIIMITSRTGDKHRQRAMELGVDHYMGKPYQEEHLLETLDELLSTQA